MPDEQPKKLDLSSMDLAAQKRSELKQLIPEAFTETRKDDGTVVEAVDFERLKTALGEFSEILERQRERYGMVWPGKNECQKIIQQPSLATLKPDRDESVNFDETENLFIEGDNLEVLKLLQKSYYGKVKMIYVDPPYNTGNDFVYPDDYSETLETYLKYSGQVDGEGKKMESKVNSKDSARFHTQWLGMIYPRLYLAKNLLRDDGVIYISIGQDEISNLISVCNDIFGGENFITICSRVMKTGGQKGVHFSPCVDYVLVYAKSIEDLHPFRVEISQNVIDKVYTKVAKDGHRKGERFRSMGVYQAGLDPMRGCKNQRYYVEAPDGELVIPPGNIFPEEQKEGSQIAPSSGEDGVWRWTYAKFKKEKDSGNIEFIKSDKTSLLNANGAKAQWNVYYRIWLKDRMEDGQLPGNILNKFENRHSSAELKVLKIPFDFAKPSSLIKFLIATSGLKDDDICLDFFAGSATTAQSILEYSVDNKISGRFICIQLPEKTPEGSEEHKGGYKTIADIGKERIRRVIKKIESEQDGKLDLEDKPKPDLGFKVFKLDRSNFKLWDSEPKDDTDEVKKQIEMHIGHIDPKASQEDILYELLLKAGYKLTDKIEKLRLAEKDVFSIQDGGLLICLEKKLTPEVIKAMADAEPQIAICLDEGFEGNDQLKTNAVQTFKSRAQGDSEHQQIVFRTV